MSIPTQYMHTVDAIKLQEWLKQTSNPRKSALILKTLEEMLELCFAAGATTDEVLQVVQKEVTKAVDRKEANGFYDANKVFDECGDVAVSFSAFIHYSGVSMTHTVAETVERISNRTWAPDEDGVLRRPK